MDTHQNPPYPQREQFNQLPDQSPYYTRPNQAPAPYPDPVQQPSAYGAPTSYPAHQVPSDDLPYKTSFGSPPTGAPRKRKSKRLNKKWQRRLYWIVPLCILAIALVILFAEYKDDFERWVKPLSDWLTARDSWSWIIPVAILVILSFPPLFGHEIVQIIVGLAYPIGVAIGIAIAGAILGEAACFVLFKYRFTKWVDKKIAAKVKWAAVSRVAQEAGFRGVLIIRYSIVPPHLANPLFSCTGMAFWLYMVTVILSLPKTIVFVVLGAPTSKGSNAAKWGKVVAIIVVVVITLFASIWIRRKMNIAIKAIEAERGIVHSDDDEEGGDEELGMLPRQSHQNARPDDTSYHGAGVGGVPQYSYPDAAIPQAHHQ